MNRAVFLDRDGVLNRPVVVEGRPYPPRRVEDIELYPGVTEACARLKAAGFLLIVATNQPDVGRGLLAREIVEAMHEKLKTMLPLDRIEVCYAGGSSHKQPSDFRKPAPGMLLRAAHEMKVALQESWMVGDRWRDIDCGRSARCRTIFVDHGYSEQLRAPPDFRVKNLLEATEIIEAAVKSRTEERK
jgi:D-glycero-D-manno-heptose 1,7-bisphosphate phosphatase